ncbi:type II secretion system secretin GspD [Ostreibacterium oceani]|nr:type II secretion system secretin GspD [Ostreibacterium oceani]
MNKKILCALGVFALLGLSGCASELQEQETMSRIQQELLRENPLQIHENRRLSNEGAEGVYGDKNGDNQSVEDTAPVFESERATGSVVNPNAKRPQYTGGRSAGTVTLNFENADLREVVKFVMTDLLEQNYILSPAVQGQVTLQTSEPIAKEDLLPTLETLLKVNGAVIVQDGDLVRILPLGEANRGTLAPKVGRIDSLKPGYEVRIIPLKYLSATEAQKNLEPFLPAGSLLQVDPVKNILTVAGTSSELANIQQTIDTFDVDWLKGMSIGVYRLQNVGVQDVLPELEGLFGASGSTPFAGLFQFIPMERLNAVMVITRQENYLVEARRWLEKLDRTNNGETERLYVYRVQNGRAEDLAGVLSGIFASSSSSTSTSTPRDPSVAPGQTPVRVTSPAAVGAASNASNAGSASTGSTGGSATLQSSLSSNAGGRSGNAVAGAQATITADEVNNSLVIKATPANYDLVLQALRQLDVPKLQVLLDVVIAEINLTDDLRYGFKYFLEKGGEGGSQQGISVSQVPEKAAGGFNYTLANIAGRVNVTIDALAQKGLAQFLSTPSLMVLDNETATMNVGEDIAIPNPVIQNGDIVSTSTTYLNTGVDLEITPRVNAGGVVQLTIKQRVSRNSGTGSDDAPNIFTREIASAINAQDGETIVLGGLIQEQSNTSRNGVPLLQDIPLAGALFRSTGRNTTRTELIVLVTPRVARNADEALNITREFRQRMKGLDIYNETKRKYSQ